MKRFAACAALLLLTVPGRTPVAAQDSTSNAALIAERREMEERMKLLSAVQSDMQQILAKQVVLEKRIADLQEEMRFMKSESARDVARYLTREDLKRIDTDLKKLADSIKDVDKNREADKKLMLETIGQMGTAIGELRKLIKVSAQLDATPPPRPSVPRDEPAPDRPPEKIKAFSHKVASGETLSGIIQAFNEKLKEEGFAKRITLDSVLKANPRLKPERMQIGQEILIPDPRD